MISMIRYSVQEELLWSLNSLGEGGANGETAVVELTIKAELGGGLDFRGDRLAVDRNLLANDVHVVDWVLDDADDLIEWSPVGVGKGHADWEHLASDSLTEGEEEDDGEETLEPRLVSEGLLPKLDVGIKLKSRLISLVNALENLQERH